MKRGIILASTAAAILTGYVVTSVCPYYTEKDLVAEPAILGNWTNTNNHDEVWKFEQTGKFVYRLTLVQSSTTTVLETHAFKLEGRLFLDIFSLERDYHVIPAHYLLKIEQTAPSLKFTELNDAWPKSFLAHKPTAVPYHNLENPGNPSDSRIVLTGDTSELQSFVLRHLNTPGAWKDAFELRPEAPILKTVKTKETVAGHYAPVFGTLEKKFQ
jgi:hypothetical protein